MFFYRKEVVIIRNPNGYGSCYKLSGKRRKPWIARVTTGWDIVDNKEKQVCETIGYYATRAEAMNALSLYNMNPWDFKLRKLTFYQVFELWFEEYKTTVTSDTARNMRTACKHAQDLHDIPMSEITVAQLERVMGKLKHESPKKTLKELYNKMYRYAMKHDIVVRNCAEYCNTVTIHTKIVRKVFTDDEIQTLWKMQADPMAAIILILLYSGWRESEITDLAPADIDWDLKIMRGGKKTEAGRERVVPIHKKVEHLVRRFYDEAIAQKKKYVFILPDKAINKKMSYNVFRPAFDDTMIAIEAFHLPHDTRHTFTTWAKHAKMDEYLLKRIIGHKIDDVTEATYTHRTIEELTEAIHLIP